MWCAGIKHFVNSVADAHDFLLPRELAFDPRIHIFQLTNVLEHVDHTFVRTAVERAFECADGGRDRRIHVRQGSDGYTGGEGGGVHPMIRMEDKGDIKNACGSVGGNFASDEIEEMLSLGEILADWR